MSWFDIAKTALSTAQRSIDKVLDIEGGNGKQVDVKDQVTTTGNNQPTSKEAVSDNDNSFWSLYNPNTHSTPKTSTGASHSTAGENFMSFDEDSQWGAYFSTPQPASLPRTAPKKAKGRTVQKRNRSPPVVDSSEVTKSLPSPGIRASKSGPLKLGSPKNKSDTTPTQPVAHDKKPGLHSDHTSQATPQLATSTNDDSSIVSSSSMHENIKSQVFDQPEHIVSHSGMLEPVSSSEHLVEPKNTENDAILPSSSTDDVASKQGGQLVASTTQDEAIAILPVTSSEAPDSSQLSNTSSPSIDSYDVITSDEKVADVIDSSENKEEMVSSSRIREEIDAPQSGEISSTAENVVMCKDNLIDNPLDDKNVNESSKQLTEPAPVETLAASSDAAEPRDGDEVKSKENISDRRNDNDGRGSPSVDGVTQTVSCGNEGLVDVPDHQVKKYEEELQNLNSEVARLNELLMARENKLVELSKDNINLRETEEILRHQLQQVEDSRQADQTGVEELKTEFTQRIATSEKKFQAVIKERDSLKNQIQVLQKDQKTSAEKQLAEELSSAKEQVTGLLEEGERLSKQQLQSNNIIKKLKAKDKESEKLIASLRQQVSENEAEIVKLSEALKKKEEKEKKYQESIAQLNAIAEQQAKELTTYKTECETLTDKARGLQTNLDNAYKEMAELHKTNALSQNAAEEATFSAEVAAKEQLKTVLEQHKMEARRQQEALTMQLAELQMSLNRSEHQTNWKEEHFKQEIADLQQRLQEAETRNQELTQSVSQATRPLLRQIENLQSVHNAQTINWERVEESLSEKLVDLQSQLNMAVARERTAVEKEHVIQSNQTGLETQLTNIKQAKAQLLATLEMEKAKAEAVQEELERERAKHHSLKNSYTQTLTDTRKEKEALQRQLEYERIQSENEMKRLMEEVAQEKERDRLASIDKTQLGLSRTSSGGSIQGGIYDRSVSMDSYSTGLGDNVPRGSLTSASTIDRLQSTLKQREGELHIIQELVTSLERSRESLANDLANTSAQVQLLQEELKTLPLVRDNLQKLQMNYDALLLMYGEKAEEAEELKLDLLDVKAMYRSQIEELLNKQR